MARIQDYKGQVTKALKAAGLYSPSTVITVNTIASALLSLEIANKEISGMTSVLLTNSTTQGQTSTAHPAFKVQRDMIDIINRGMKQLGLTTAEVVTKPEVRDAVDAMMEMVNGVK